MGTVLSFLQILLNWPVLVSFIILIFIFKFDKQIKDFLSRLVKAKANRSGFSLESSPPKQEKVIVENDKKITMVKMIENNPKKAHKEFLKLYEEYFFERSFNTIFGTQINLLEHLDKKPDKSEKYNFLFVKFYFKHLGRKPKTKEPYNKYLNFLEDSKFIKILNMNNEKIVEITSIGTKFLVYIKTRYSTKYKSKPF